jgi:hypothetical protein
MFKAGDLVVSTNRDQITGMLGVVISVDKIIASRKGVPFKYVKVYFANAPDFKTRFVQSNHLVVVNESL